MRELQNQPSYHFQAYLSIYLGYECYFYRHFYFLRVAIVMQRTQRFFIRALKRFIQKRGYLRVFACYLCRLVGAYASVGRQRNMQSRFQSLKTALQKTV